MKDKIAHSKVEVATSLGSVARGQDRVYRVSYQERIVLWVLEEDDEL